MYCLATVEQAHYSTLVVAIDLLWPCFNIILLLLYSYWGYSCYCYNHLDTLTQQTTCLYTDTIFFDCISIILYMCYTRLLITLFIIRRRSPCKLYMITLLVSCHHMWNNTPMRLYACTFACHALHLLSSRDRAHTEAPNIVHLNASTVKIITCRNCSYDTSLQVVTSQKIQNISWYFVKET